jgi:hypothetical protein
MSRIRKVNTNPSRAEAPSTLSLLEPGVTHGITLQRIKSAIKDGGSR